MVFNNILLFVIMVSIFIGIDGSYPIAHKILSYENYFVGIVGNILIMMGISHILDPKLTLKYNQIKNKINKRKC